MKTPEAANFVFQWIFVLNSVKHASSSMWLSLKNLRPTLRETSFVTEKFSWLKHKKKSWVIYELRMWMCEWES